MESTKAPESYIAPVYERLGRRAFMLILSKYLNTGIGFFVIAIVVLIMRKQSFVAQSNIGQSGLLGWGVVILFIISVFSMLVGLFIAWIFYKNNTFAITEDAFKIRRGIFQKIEVAIPYRQIQDINLKRSLFQQIAGVSRIEILTANEDTDKDSSNDTVLDSIDKDIAERLQSELIHRANVQKTITQKV